MKKLATAWSNLSLKKNIASQKMRQVQFKFDTELKTKENNMKQSSLLKVSTLPKNELLIISGGGVDPDALREYIEERYGKETGYNFSR